MVSMPTLTNPWTKLMFPSSQSAMLNVMLRDDAFAEVVEDRDLGRQPADVGDPTDGVGGQIEAPLHPRLDGVVDV